MRKAKSYDYDTSINLTMKLNDVFSSILCDRNLLPPQKFKIIGNTMLATWHLVGTFGTKSAFEFLQDIKARIQLTFKEAEYIETISKSVKKCRQAYEAKAFSGNLFSLPNFNKYSEKHAQHDKKDNIFWAIKLHFERMIKKGVVNYDLLEIWALDNFVGKTEYACRTKTRSDICCKTRAVYRWYAERNFKPSYVKMTPEQREKYEMTRAENAKQLHKIKAERIEKKIISLLTSLLGVNYKHSSGDWNISKIAKELEIDIRTSRKYVRNLQSQGIL